MHHPFHDQIEYRVRLIHLSEKVEATPSIMCNHSRVPHKHLSECDDADNAGSDKQWILVHYTFAMSSQHELEDLKKHRDFHSAIGFQNGDC